MSEVPDPEVIELATKVFDLARRGETEALAAYVDAGVPANLTNDRGDTLVMLAAYHGHASAVPRPPRPRRRGRPRQRPRPDPARGSRLQGRGRGDPGAAGRRSRSRPREPPPPSDTARMFGKTDLLELFGDR